MRRSTALTLYTFLLDHYGRATMRSTKKGASSEERLTVEAEFRRDEEIHGLVGAQLQELALQNGLELVFRPRASGGIAVTFRDDAKKMFHGRGREGT